MKKTALYVQNEASKKFNPYTLKDFLIRTDNGEIIVDRSLLIKNKEDERLFYVILNKDYGWNYRHPEDSTIYFQVVDGKVYGGVYDYTVGRLTTRLIAVEYGMIDGATYIVYNYNTQTLSKIIDSILNS